MKSPCLLLFSLLTFPLFAQESVTFETFNQGLIPFPAGEKAPKGIEPLVEFLADLAVTEDLEEGASAKLLAAALRLQPTNKKAFYTEYELSIGIPTSLTRPAESIDATLAQHFQDTLQGDQWQQYKKFIEATIKGQPYDYLSGSGPTKSCTIPTIDSGPVVLSVSKEKLDIDGFEFAAWGLDTSYFRSAYREVVKYSAQTQSTELTGHRFTFQSEGEVGEGEGPVAALAAAVLSDAMVSNQSVDPKVCLSGDVNADGTVQPMDDQRERILSAAEDSPAILVLPKGDRYVVDDVLLLDGPMFFIDCQVFEVGNVSQAVAISTDDRDDDLAKAMALFLQIQKVLKGPNGEKYFANSHVRQRLEKLLELAPNHLSAQQLLKVSKKQAPRHLSLYASFDLVFDPIGDLYDAKKETFRNAESIDEEALAELEKYKSKIDPALQNLAQAVFGYKASERSLGADVANTKARLLGKLKQELTAVSRDVRIKEKMMR